MIHNQKLFISPYFFCFRSAGHSPLCAIELDHCAYPASMTSNDDEDNVEVRPLVAINSNRSSGGDDDGGVNEKYAAKTPCNYKKWGIVGFVVALMGIFLVGHRFVSSTNKKPLYSQVHQTIHKSNNTESTGSDKGTTPVSASVALRPKPTRTPPKKKKKKGASSIWTAAFMTSGLTAARANLEAQMRAKYGTYYDSLFSVDGAKVGRTVMLPGGDAETNISWTRFQRKLLIKLLQVQTSPSSETSSKTAGTTETPLPVSFVWASGGHSAAAGHGNFFNESYSYVLEQAAHDVFAAVGINFVVRKYAMGATSAATEISLCAKEIFGKDIDLLLWDFGMTDGNQFWKQNLYHWRAALLKETKPVHIVYQGDGYDERRQAIRKMQDLGFSSFMSSGPIFSKIMAAIPDSFGLNEAQIQAMPPNVRSFRCDQQIENGDPYCGEQKYSQPCMPRRGTVSWHPGWKWHALMGYVAALFVVEILDDALKELVSLSDEDPDTLLSQLLVAEDADYAAFEREPVQSSMFQEIYPPSGQDGFDLELFVKGHNFCHTAKLPAEIRFKGILTESNQTGFYTYDHGIEVGQAKSTNSTTDLMRLTYTDADRRDRECPIDTILDFKDYFYVDDREGWKKLVVPNDAALKEYGNGQPLQGLVVLCFAICEWGACPNGSVGRDEAFPAAYEVQINGVAVAQLWPIQGDVCAISKNADGFKWVPNADGRFEVQIRINKTSPPGSFLQLSSVIVY
jgi:hypothetical protein